MIRADSFWGTLAFLATLISAGCASVPQASHKKYTFPSHEAYVGDVKRPYEKLGLVRTKVEYPTLSADTEEQDLCKNYYNKAVRDLVQRARKQGGDAVIDVKSVVFLEDGRMETYPTPECSDDGEEGQILAEGIVVKWKAEDPVQRKGRLGPEYAPLGAEDDPFDTKPKRVSPAASSRPSRVPRPQD